MNAQERAVMQKALEALEKARDTTHSDTLYAQFEVAITVFRAALAQPLPDPADEYRKGFIDGQIDMRDRPEEQEPPTQAGALHAMKTVLWKQEQDEQAEKAPHTILKLPPLPEPNWNERVYGGFGNEITHHWFTDHQMREYARQAVCESEDAWQSRLATPPRRETEREPVAWVDEASIAWLAEHPRGIITTRLVKQKSPERQMAMYAEPPRREWQSLSEEEINELSHTMVKGHKSVNWLARAIEAKLKEKNNG